MSVGKIKNIALATVLFALGVYGIFFAEPTAIFFVHFPNIAREPMMSSRVGLVCGGMALICLSALLLFYVKYGDTD